MHGKLLCIFESKITVLHVWNRQGRGEFPLIY
jgi:hypothetical protein